jgi:hypothetical protein
MFKCKKVKVNVFYLPEDGHMFGRNIQEITVYITNLIYNMCVHFVSNIIEYNRLIYELWIMKGERLFSRTYVRK